MAPPHLARLVPRLEDDPDRRGEHAERLLVACLEGLAPALVEQHHDGECAPAAVEESLAVLSRAGLVEDSRFARTRASSLADRGYGDAAIRHDLERHGVEPEPIQEALESLDAESMRAQRLVIRRGPGPRTARYLAGKGFGEEAVEAAAGGDFAPDP